MLVLRGDIACMRTGVRDNASAAANSDKIVQSTVMAYKVMTYKDMAFIGLYSYGPYIYECARLLQPNQTSWFEVLSSNPAWPLSTYTTM